MRRLSCRVSDDLGDFDAEVLIDHHDFTTGDELVVHIEADWLAGELVELKHGAFAQFHDIPHGQHAGSDADGEIDFDIEDDGEVFSVVDGAHCFWADWISEVIWMATWPFSHPA